MKLYVYIVVRKDMKPEHYAPQIAHAALEAGYQSSEPDTKTHIVVLQVQTKEELRLLSLCMFGEGIVYEEVHEGFANMGLTALATLPSKKLTHTCLGKLSLFKY